MSQQTHPNDAKCICDICGFKCSTPNARKSHKSRCLKKMREAMSPTFLQRLKCTKCLTGGFKSKNDLKDHNKVCHVTCQFCGKKFSKKFIATRHEDLMHRPRHEIESTKFKCEMCEKLFHSKKSIEKHMNECLLARTDLHRYVFSSHDQMQQWLEDTQLETHSYFSSHGGTSSRNDSVFTYKYCQHHQRGERQISHSYRKTDRKRKFGLVPDYACPAKISICKKGSSYHVKYFSKHNHPLTPENLKYQPFPASLRNEILTKISNGETPTDIYMEKKAENEKKLSSDPKIDKTHLLTKRYISQMRSKEITTTRNKLMKLLHPSDVPLTLNSLKPVKKERKNLKPVQKKPSALHLDDDDNASLPPSKKDLQQTSSSNKRSQPFHADIAQSNMLPEKRHINHAEFGDVNPVESRDINHVGYRNINHVESRDVNQVESGTEHASTFSTSLPTIRQANQIITVYKIYRPLPPATATSSTMSAETSQPSQRIRVTIVK